MPSAASRGSCRRSATITSGIPERAATAAMLAVQMSPNGLKVSVTLMLGSSAWHCAMTRRTPLRLTGDPQKWQNAMPPDTSGLRGISPCARPVGRADRAKSPIDSASSAFLNDRLRTGALIYYLQWSANISPGVASPTVPDVRATAVGWVLARAVLAGGKPRAGASGVVRLPGCSGGGDHLHPVGFEAYAPVAGEPGIGYQEVNGPERGDAGLGKAFELAGVCDDHGPFGHADAVAQGQGFVLLRDRVTGVAVDAADSDEADVCEEPGQV